MGDEKINHDGTKLILDEWKTVIDTQMHFNEMIMKMRTTSVSVILAVFSAAAYSLQYDVMIPIYYVGEKHVAFFIVLFGLVMLFAIFILDYFYYFKMLLGAVERGYQIDKSYEERLIDESKMFGMTSLIRDKIGKASTSKYLILLYYAIIFFIGIIFLCSVFHYVPQIGENNL